MFTLTFFPPLDPGILLLSFFVINIIFVSFICYFSVHSYFNNFSK